MLPPLTSTLIKSLPTNLLDHRQIIIDSSKTLVKELKKKKGVKGHTKVPTPVPQIAGPISATIKPLDLLHAIGRITTPIIPNLVDLSSTWAIYRYMWAFAEKSPKLHLSTTATEIDFHQKGLLSDEIGVGMTYWLMCSYLGVVTPPVDVSLLLRNQNVRGIVTIPPVLWKNSIHSIPDYIFVLPNGDYAIVECKGTQTNKTAALNQIRRGLEQVPSIVFPGGQNAHEFVVSTLITKTKTEVRIVDPPHNDVEGEDGTRIIVSNKRQFDNIVKKLQAANVLAFAGVEGRSATLAELDVHLDNLRQEPLEVRKSEETSTIFRGYSFLLPVRGQIGRELSVFCGVAAETYNYITSEDFEHPGFLSYWPTPEYWERLSGRSVYQEGHRHVCFTSTKSDNGYTVSSFSKDGTILQITVS